MSQHRDPNRRETLRRTCRETLDVVDQHLQDLGRERDARRWHKHSLATLPAQHSSLCPRYPQPATIRVVNEDTLNAAISLATGLGGASPTCPDVAIMIFANRHSPGGGWRNGAVAQEEAVCYRSSLALSIDGAGYPLARDEAVFSPYVLVMREDMARAGHRLMAGRPEDLPVVSALVVAAIYKPEVEEVALTSSSSARRLQPAGLNPTTQQQSGSASRQTSLFSYPKFLGTNSGSGSVSSTHRPGGSTTSGGSSNGAGATAGVREIFALGRDRHYTKEKMRLALRMAANHGKRSLVLGAFGCGVYANPPEDVARCWLEVLQDDEFRRAGNWWRDVIFAVYDPRGEGNYDIFRRVLHGRQV